MCSPPALDKLRMRLLPAKYLPFIILTKSVELGFRLVASGINSVPLPTSLLKLKTAIANLPFSILDELCFGDEVSSIVKESVCVVDAGGRIDDKPKTHVPTYLSLLTFIILLIFST